MKPLNTLTGDALEQMIDYKVVDQAGESIGTLHSLWSDPATGAVEFLGVKTGWLFGQNHVVPADKAELDDTNNVVRLPYTEAFIKEAPTMSADAEISEAEEDEIFRYYGLPRRAALGDTVASNSDPYTPQSGATTAEEEELDAGATYVGNLPTKLKDTPAQNISITDRRDDLSANSRLRRTSRPPTAGDETVGVDATSGNAPGLGGMTSPTNDDFINGGASAITSGVGSGAYNSEDDPSKDGPLGDTSLKGSTFAADDIGGNTSTTLLTGSEDYTDTAEGRTFGATDPAENPDPITGEPGSHPVGTGAGAMSAGAAGVAIGGVIGGPVGAIIGGIAGAIGGGLAGKGVAEAINPTAEGEYWNDNYQGAPYYEEGREYSDYEPAYRVGYEGYGRHGGPGKEDFSAAETSLEKDYEQAKGASSLEWEKAKHAARDAWQRVSDKAKGESGK